MVSVVGVVMTSVVVADVTVDPTVSVWVRLELKVTVAMIYQPQRGTCDFSCERSKALRNGRRNVPLVVRESNAPGARWGVR